MCIFVNINKSRKIYYNKNNVQDKYCPLLRCPISGEPLKIEVLERHQKQYNNCNIDEIYTAILYSPNGMIFPIIYGVPRLLTEAIILFKDFFNTHLPDFKTKENDILSKHGSIIQECYKKNKNITACFSFEWNLLKRDSTDKIWHQDEKTTVKKLFKEINEHDVRSKNIVEIGCGHGFNSEILAQNGAFVFAMDISFSIEKAYLNQNHENIFYIQGDLQYPPFEKHSFDIVYSSGVIHYTKDPRLSFKSIEALAKEQGKFCLWLYKPYNSIIHNLFLKARHITKHISPKVLFYLFIFTLIPIYYIVLYSKKRKMDWREIMIDLINGFAPFYRFELIPEDVISWYKAEEYSNIKITDTNIFGFAIVGTKLLRIKNHED